MRKVGLSNLQQLKLQNRPITYLPNHLITQIANYSITLFPQPVQLNFLPVRSWYYRRF
jgi:hypothetical protein